jgi:hypothetical protein
MDHSPTRKPTTFLSALLLMLSALLIPAIACSLTEEEPPWTPEAPRQYSAETAPVDVYVLLDSAGNVVDFGGAYSYGANAKLRYVLRFWDIGELGAEGYEIATIHKAYTPVEITGIQVDLEADLSQEQKAEVYSRTSFPTTEIKWADLNFTGGPQGYFSGTNPDTGEDILGQMEWREEAWEMHAVFTRDIQQDYLVLGEEVFYNWP